MTDSTDDRSGKKTLDVVLAAALALGLSLACLFAGAGAYNNDQWFILENGRWILENGFPREDPFHVWGGSIVVENWLWSVVMYIAWNVTGSPVIPAMIVWSFGGLIVFTAWRISKEFSDSVMSASLSALFAIIMIAGSLNMVMRPSVASLALTMSALLMVVKYAKTGSRRYLAIIPLIMLLAFNLHMSMSWLVILVPGVFMLSHAITEAILTKSSRRVSLVVVDYAVTVMASMIMTTLNPYGLDGSMFLLKSAGIADYRNQIFELMPLVPLFDSGNTYYSITAMISYLGIMVLCLLTLAGLFKPWRMVVADETGEATVSDMILETWIAGVGLLASGIIATSLIAIRLNVIFVFSAPLLFSVASIPMRRWLAKKTDSRRKCLEAILVVTVTIAVAMTPWAVTPIKIPLYDWWYGYVSSLDTTLVEEELDKSGGKPGDKVWSDGIYGAYLVWKGYKVTHDMRPELIEPALNGKPGHHYYDYTDAQYFDDESALERTIRDGQAAGCKWWVVDDSKPVGKKLAGDSNYKKVGSVPDFDVSIYEYIGDGRQ